MNINISRYYIFTLLLALVVKAQVSRSDQPSQEVRQARATGRIVKIYSGYKPDPIYCTDEGFQADSKNCAIFYRCSKSGKGKFTVHKFECAPGTIYDPEIEVCNYPRSTKRLECGGFSDQTLDGNDINDIDMSQQLLPSPTTKMPMYLENIPHASTKHPVTTIKESKKNTSTTMKPIATSITYEVNEINKSSNSLDLIISSSTLRPLSSSTNPKSTNVVNITLTKNNICTSDGFMGDYENCHKFYRCVANNLGGFTKYEFSCSEPTIWDDDIKSCNHQWAVKRGRCGKRSVNAGPVMILNVSRPLTTSDNDDSLSKYGGNSQSIQEQTQISYGTKVTQSQIQISQGSGVLKQTQINYGDRINEPNKNNQNQTQLSHGSAISQTQSQLSYGNKVLQTQIQIDHSSKSSQSQTQISESTTEISKEEQNNQTTTKSNDTCTQTGFMGDTSNCKIFYRCVNNGKGGYTRYAFLCGEGTLWDKKLEICNHAWAVNDCEYKSFAQETQTKTSISAIKSTKTDTTFTKVLKTNTTANKDKNYNDKNNFYYNINQNDDTTTTSFSVTTTTNVNGFKFEERECTSGGFMGDKMNCQIFYRCVDDGRGSYTKYKFQCEEGTLWDPDIEACNHAWAVNNCEGQNTQFEKNSANSDQPSEVNISKNTLENYNYSSTTTYKTTQVISAISSEKDIKCTKSGFIGDNKDCKKFYRCVDNEDGSFTRYEFSCADGTVWDGNLETCNYKESMEKCNKSNETLEVILTEVKEQSTSEILPENEENYVTQSTNYHEKTTKGTITSSSSLNINLEKNQTSSTSPSIISNCSTTQLVSPSTNDSKFEEKEISSSGECYSKGFYGDTKNCKKYYRCVTNENGGFIKYEFICSEGTAWDKDIKACNHIHLVKSCQNVSSESETTSTEDFKSTTAVSNNQQTDQSISNEKNDEENDCEYEGYFGDTSDCKKFYRCVINEKNDYIKYNFTCGDGTIWDQDITACNHPYDIKNLTCKQDNSVTDTSTSSSTSISTPMTQSSISITENTEQTLTTSKPGISNQPAHTNLTCTEAGFFSNPSNCKEFYRCVDWYGNGSVFSIFYFECGEGTIWDPALETCNHEESVIPPRNCSYIESESDEHKTTTYESATLELSSSQQTSSQTSTQSRPSEKTSTQQTTTQQMITEQTTQLTTTSTQSTTHKTTTKLSVSSEQTTTQKSSPAEDTISQETTTNEQYTSEELTTTEQSNITSEEQTTQQSTTSEQTTQKQSTTTKESTSTTKKDFSTSEQTITSDSSIESTTVGSTTKKYTIEQTETEQYGTTDSSTSNETSAMTQSNIESTTEGNMETTIKDPSDSEKKCPKTDQDQYLFVCPTSFKRHHKYCNLFYQCTKDDDTHDAKIAVFTCPNDTIYDESKVQCVEEKKAEKACMGEIASRRRVKRLGINYKEPIVVSPDNHSCTVAGHVPFETNSECSPAFLKCEKSKSGQLQGFVYQCPQNYIYWSISRRCERQEYVRDCKRTVIDWNGRWQIPVEKNNVAW